MPKLKFDGGKRMFSFVGNTDPRQNVAAILLAFEKLWDDGVDAPLTILGANGDQAPVEASIVERLRGREPFNQMDKATDGFVRHILNESRATISVGSAEGFGIAAYESLHAGVPVIALKGIPSLDLISPGGRLTIDAATPDLIANAVRKLLDDRIAEGLWNDAAGLQIPTWKGFVKQLAKWLQGEIGTMKPGEHDGK
ncbi:glycosyltransferase [Phyllobacterium trifolii]|nr:glycosyltransferase [Phyllobacterium trifolii]